MPGHPWEPGPISDANQATGACWRQKLGWWSLGAVSAAGLLPPGTPTSAVWHHFANCEVFSYDQKWNFISLSFLFLGVCDAVPVLSVAKQEGSHGVLLVFWEWEFRLSFIEALCFRPPVKHSKSLERACSCCGCPGVCWACLYPIHSCHQMPADQWNPMSLLLTAGSRSHMDVVHLVGKLKEEKTTAL
ncbi:uncharacterized protein LOC135450076 [Zonotrichia leucophrys gambelii]|uniref:uncharacterized protein LOC135450076 n=1 Tax=Zonotrichia leucophrys gambelii TaxID=257770 RepID=UPI00314035D0